ncbi:MAG: hypothetical protein ABH829_01505 [archaeon]
MGKRTFIFIIDEHEHPFYPNDLARHIRGKRALYLKERLLHPWSMRAMQQEYAYAQIYTKFLHGLTEAARQQFIESKEAVWKTRKKGSRRTDKPVENRFLVEYLEKTATLFPEDVRDARDKILKSKVLYTEETRQKDVVLTEACIDYAKEADFVSADLREPQMEEISDDEVCTIYYRDEAPWIVDVNLGKVDKKTLEAIYANEDPWLRYTPLDAVRIGAGIKELIEMHKEVDVFLAMWGSAHYPEVVGFAEGAGCKVITKVYDHRSESIDRHYKRDRKLVDAFKRISKKAKIGQIEIRPHHNMKLSDDYWKENKSAFGRL